MKCPDCNKELADVQHGSGVAEDHSQRGAEYPKWIEALGRVVQSKQEEDEALKEVKPPESAPAIKPLSEMLSTQQAPEAPKPPLA